MTQLNKHASKASKCTAESESRLNALRTVDKNMQKEKKNATSYFVTRSPSKHLQLKFWQYEWTFCLYWQCSTLTQRVGITELNTHPVLSSSSHTPSRHLKIKFGGMLLCYGFGVGLDPNFSPVGSLIPLILPEFS